jgi:hypothetical protein
VKISNGVASKYHEISSKKNVGNNGEETMLSMAWRSEARRNGEMAYHGVKWRRMK